MHDSVDTGVGFRKVSRLLAKVRVRYIHPKWARQRQTTQARIKNHEGINTRKKDWDAKTQGTETIWQEICEVWAQKVTWEWRDPGTKSWLGGHPARAWRLAWAFWTLLSTPQVMAPTTQDAGRM